MIAKYVIMEVCGCEVPIVFAPEIEHRCMASIGRLVSAGWCEPRANWIAFGLSQGLAISCRPDRDTELLRMYFGTPVEETKSPHAGVDSPIRLPSRTPNPPGAT